MQLRSRCGLHFMWSWVPSDISQNLGSFVTLSLEKVEAAGGLSSLYGYGKVTTGSKVKGVWLNGG